MLQPQIHPGAVVMIRTEGFGSWAPRWALRLGVVTALCVVGACGAQTSEPDVDGQSHWWQSCAQDDDCGGGFQCACGACTRPCTETQACGSTEHVQCALRPGLCQEEYELADARVCQVACQSSKDCPGSLECHTGVCVSAELVDDDETRLATSMTPDSPDAGSEVLQCGEPGQTTCPPPPQDWCSSDGDLPLPEGLIAYWSSFCDAGLDASVASTCGDGIIGADEVCDDGNTMAGDGCATNCQAIESNYDCTTGGQPCQPSN